MQTNEPLYALAKDIHEMESQGARLADGWYRFDRGTDADLHTMKDLSLQSLERLTQLSSGLEARLRGSQTGTDRDRLEHAYNLVQELIQSRTANQSLLDDMIQSDNHGFFEYFRALAIKEKAAEAQTAELTDLLQ